MEKSCVKYQPTYFVAITMLLVGSSVVMNFFKVPVAMGILAEEMKLADPSILMSVFTFVGIILAVPAALFINKFGAKNMSVTACIIVGIGSLIGAFATNGTMLIVSRAIEGIGYILISVSGPVTICTFVRPTDIGAAMGVWAIWMAVGQIVGQNLEQFMLNAGNTWKTVWIVYGIAAIVMGVICALLVKKPEGLVEPSSAPGEKEDGALKQLLVNKNFVKYLIAFFCFNILIIQLTTYIPAFSQTETVGMDATEAAFAGTVLMIAGMFCGPIFGKIGDKIGRRWIVVIALIGATAGAAIAFSGSRVAVYAGSVIFGLIAMATPGNIMSAVPGFVGEKLNSLATGVLFVGVNAGQFLATALWGSLMGASNGSYTMAIMICAVPLGVLAVILAMLTKYN